MQLQRLSCQLQTINRRDSSGLRIYTLVYRIEKLQKSTGLDVRTFDDALTFKIAMMVVNYMKYLDHLNY